MDIELTHELIEQARSENGGWSKKQLEIINVDWPPPKGWKKRCIGNQLEQKKIDRFIFLRDNHL